MCRRSTILHFFTETFEKKGLTSAARGSIMRTCKATGSLSDGSKALFLLLCAAISILKGNGVFWVFRPKGAASLL
jgi:hypothetical protein